MIELMVVVAIAAVLAGLAAPSVSELMVNNRLRAHASALHTSLLQARTEAIKRSGRVVVCKSADGATCVTSGDWQQGWIMFADADNDAQADAGEVLLQKVATLSGKFLLRGDGNVANYVSYSGTGASKLAGSETFQSGTITLCQLGVTDGKARQIELFATGRLTVGQQTVATCAN